MPTTIESQLKISNANLSDWAPRTRVVEGLNFVKMDCKDRSCFRFLTGRTLHFGSRYHGETKYLLEFWQSLVKARSDASQSAFECMQKDLQDAAGSEEGGRKKRQRFRRARIDDALTVGRIVDLHVAHGDNDYRLKALFGVKKGELWIEATSANMDFIAAAMTADYNAGNFASTRPRGPHFKLQDDEGSDDAGADGDAEGDAEDDAGAAD